MRKISLLLFCLAAFAGQAQTRPEGSQAGRACLVCGKDKLFLNGNGVLERFYLEMYEGSLFLAQPCRDACRIVNADEAMAIRLRIISSLITPARMEKAVREGFERSTNGNIALIRKQVDEIVKIFSADINSDDRYDLVYLPENGLSIIKNGREMATFKGLEFKKAVFGIWLGEKPADSDLKKSMLGS